MDIGTAMVCADWLVIIQCGWISQLYINDEWGFVSHELFVSQVPSSEDMSTKAEEPPSNDQRRHGRLYVYCNYSDLLSV
jgi:hypothetical protein